MVSESRSASRSPSRDTPHPRIAGSGQRSSISPLKSVVVPRQASECGILDRLATRGVPSLSDAELLALVLPGPPGNSTHDLARELLDTCGGVAGLLNCDFGISRAQGLNEQQAAAVLAAVELGRRLVSTPNRSAILADPEMAARAYQVPALWSKSLGSRLSDPWSENCCSEVFAAPYQVPALWSDSLGSRLLDPWSDSSSLRRFRHRTSFQDRRLALLGPRREPDSASPPVKPRFTGPIQHSSAVTVRRLL